MMNIEAMKHSIKWFTPVGKVTRKAVKGFGWFLMRFARALFRWSLGRCCMCGVDYGMQGNVTGKGGYCEPCYKRYIAKGRINAKGEAK